MAHDPFKALQEFKLKSGKTGKYYSLAALEKAGLGKTSRMQTCARIISPVRRWWWPMALPARYALT